MKETADSEKWLVRQSNPDFRGFWSCIFFFFFHLFAGFILFANTLYLFMLSNEPSVELRIYNVKKYNWMKLQQSHGDVEMERARDLLGLVLLGPQR